MYWCARRPLTRFLRYYSETDEDRPFLGRAIYQLESSLLQKCSDIRRRKELELSLLQQPIRNWNGESIQNLGTMRLMIQVKNASGKLFLTKKFFLHQPRFLNFWKFYRFWYQHEKLHVSVGVVTVKHFLVIITYNFL